MNALKYRRGGIYTAAALAVSCLSMTAYGAPITGILNIAGGVSVSATKIDFLPIGGMSGTTAADAFSNTGSFAVLNTGNPAAESPGTILDLTGPPLVGAISVPDFISNFSLAPNIVLNLTFINPGSYGTADCSAPAAVNQNCSPPGSPFNLSNTLSGGVLSTVISLGVSGTAVNTSTGEQSAFTGTFSTQVNGVPLQNILATLSSGGSETTTYSGQFTASAVPEPGTTGLIFGGLGMLCVGLIGKRVRARHE